MNVSSSLCPRNKHGVITYYFAGHVLQVTVLMIQLHSIPQNLIPNAKAPKFNPSAQGLVCLAKGSKVPKAGFKKSKVGFNGDKYGLGKYPPQRYLGQFGNCRLQAHEAPGA